MFRRLGKEALEHDAELSSPRGLTLVISSDSVFGGWPDAGKELRRGQLAHRAANDWKYQGLHKARLND